MKKNGRFNRIMVLREGIKKEGNVRKYGRTIRKLSPSNDYFNNDVLSLKTIQNVMNNENYFAKRLTCILIVLIMHWFKLINKNDIVELLTLAGIKLKSAMPIDGLIIKYINGTSIYDDIGEIMNDYDVLDDIVCICQTKKYSYEKTKANIEARKENNKDADAHKERETYQDTIERILKKHGKKLSYIYKNTFIIQQNWSKMMSKRIIYDKRNNCAYIPELSVSRDFAAALAIELYNKLNITKSEAVEIFESFGYCIRENDEQDYIIRKSLNLQ